MSHAPRERVSWNNTCINDIMDKIKSRSTWACELKSLKLINVSNNESHAPRERVSWNDNTLSLYIISLVTLHVSVWVEIVWQNHWSQKSCVTLHVSVWVEMQ